MWIVHWKINGKSGHGTPVSHEVASKFCKTMNERWGEGTHWMEQA